ncbi:MAG: EamA family transporter [Salinigranum sp.]
MIQLSAALALFAALCFGLQALVVQRGMERGTAFAAAFVSIVVSGLLFWGLAALRGIPVADLTSTRVLPFVVAGIGYPAMFRLLYFEGIDRVGPSLASAIIAANPAIAAVFAIAALGEGISATVVGGLLLIIVGAAVLQFARDAGDGDAAVDLLVRRLSDADRSDLLYPAAAMALYGGASVLIKFGLSSFPSVTTATAVTQTTAFVVFAALIAVSGEARSSVRVGDRYALASFVVAGVFVALAWLGQFFALQLGTVVTVMPLVNVYSLLVVLLSYAAAREMPRSPQVLASVLAIVAGATLLQL